MGKLTGTHCEFLEGRCLLDATAQVIPCLPPAGYDQGGQYSAGSINTVSYYSSVAGTNLNMMVYTPPNYNPSQKYGVIYCYQGVSTGIDTIFDDWCVDAGIVADNLIGQGKIKPIIIVAVDDQFNGTYGSNVRDMTVNDAIPFVDSHYSTYADADHRGVYGFSWGGGYAFNVGCENLDVFHYVSPSSAAPSKDSDDTLFPNGGAQARQKLKTLLISCGNADYLGLYGPSEGAHNYCVANGIPHAWWPVNGGGHDSGVWRPAMWNFLQLADQAGISSPSLTRSAYSQVEAESYGSQSGVMPETCGDTGGGQDIGSIQNGAYAVYRNIDFGTGAVSFDARVASNTSGGNIEVHLDSANGKLVGTCAVAGTGGWQTWVTQHASVSGASGIHDVYLKFTGGGGYLFNVNWWKFNTSSWPVSPSAPSSVVASAGAELATLSWTTVSNATSYSVKRATSSGGPYTTIANVAGTTYTDRRLIGGTTYYYRVSALNVGGESADSAQASVTPTVNVPSPWLTRDIGAGGLAGGASFNNGLFTLVGCGTDIQDPADAFRFVQVPTNGDCTIVARVASLDGYISSWSKAGLMIRESMDANAANAFIGVTPGNGVVWQSRSSAGGSTTYGNTTGPSAPYWVKLVRSGNTFTGYYSSDGTSWTPLGTTTFAMASTAYIGLALTSHNDYTLCTATFDHVTAPGWAPVPAPTPTGLTATAGVEQVALSWTASSNATSYNVKRATSSGGPYTTVANVTTTNYSDTRLIGGTAYYYVVSAVNSAAGESDNSAEVSATPAVNVPSPWTTRDIGSTAQWGSASFTNGAFTVAGSGADIWGSADAFRFAYVQTNSTSFSISARVASVQNIDGWSKAGVMIRDSLDPGAANAFIALTPGYGVTFQSRSSDGGGCSNTTTGGNAPYWVKLVRSSDTFTGYTSLDGVTWTQAGSTTLTNVSTAYIGLAVTSHNNSSLCTATFDHVSVPGWSYAPLAATATAVSSSQVNLAWNAMTNATSYNVKRSTTTGGPYTTIATGITTTNYTDTTAPVSAGCYYVISAIVGGRESANGPEAAMSPELVWYQADASSDSTLADYSGHNNTATLSGSYSFASGVSGNALSLSGGNASLPTGIVSGLNNFTISTWVKLSSLDTWSRIFDFGTGTSMNMFLTPQAGGTNLPRFAITTGGGGGEQRVESNTAIPLGVWTHVAVTLSGNTCTLYLNGKVVGTNTNMTIHPAALGSTTQNYLGKSQYSDPALQGSIDDFRLYGWAFSASEVLALSTPTVAAPASASADPVTGTSTTLSVLGADVTGGETGLLYTWSCTSKPTGAADPTFSANGNNAAKSTTATFKAAGSYTFLVTIRNSGGLSVTSSVSVNVNQTLTSIAVTPDGASVSQGATRQFTATGYDQFGAVLATQPSFIWSSTGGSFSTSTPGLWTAGTTTGTYSVKATSGGISGSASVRVVDTTAAVLVSAGSVKTHGTAGSFEIPLNLSGNAAVECRANGPTQLVVRFNEAVTLGSNFSLGLSSGTGQATVSGSTITISMSGATDGQLLCATLNNVSDLAGNLGTYKLYLAVLLGDVNGNGSVTSQDMTVVKNNDGKTANAANFRADLNCNGTVTSQDMTVVKNRDGRTVDRAIPASSSSALLTLVSDKSKTNSLLA